MIEVALQKEVAEREGVRMHDYPSDVADDFEDEAACRTDEYAPCSVAQAEKGV